GTQKLVRLPEGHGLMLTTERYLQNDGTPIHGRGPRPTVIVEIPPIGFDEPKPTADPVLERGVRELTSPTPSTPTASATTPGAAVTGTPANTPNSPILGTR